ncbi:MAG: matrixin family metalloprotease [Blastochloris sp.]|nr:matrixin family metalloprotease [Blastochloris sp.]
MIRRLFRRCYCIAAVTLIAISLIISPQETARAASGTCWQTGAKWSSNAVTYSIASSIPSSWISSIDNGANAWIAVTPSPFTLSRADLSPNTVSRGTVSDDSWIAVANVFASPTQIDRIDLVFNQNKQFTTALPPPSNTYLVQNVATHEFGHWVFLADVTDFICTETTMYSTIAFGETKKQSLAQADIDGLNTQYP